MAGLSELEIFLRDQATVGKINSSGKFTLSQEQALKKMAQFRLPRKEAWILKVVQSAVASGAGPIKIHQLRNVTKVVYTPRKFWSIDEVKQALLTLDPLPDVALAHLRGALWHVGMGMKRPFRLSFGGESPTLVWTGSRFQDEPPGASSDTVMLQILHYSLDLSILDQWLQGLRYWLPSWALAKSVETHGDIAGELRMYGCACSVPLSIDNRRVDGLHLCPTHRSATSYPFTMGLCSLKEVPPLALPRSNSSLYGISILLVSERVGPPVHKASAAMVLAFHVSPERTPQPRSSVFCWVLDGIIIDREKMSVESSVSAVVFASAAHLSTDLSGLSLIRGQECSQCRAQVCRALDGWLGGLKLESEYFEIDGDGNIRLAEKYSTVTDEGYTKLETLFSFPPKQFQTDDFVGGLKALQKGWLGKK